MSQLILRIAAIAAAVALSSALTSCNIGNEAKSEKWEYKITCPSYSTITDSTADEMNVEGAEGWELVAVTSSNSGIYYYFKRRLP